MVVSLVARDCDRRSFAIDLFDWLIEAIGDRIFAAKHGSHFPRSRPAIAIGFSRDSRSRRTLPASALKSIVRSKKTKSTIGKLFLIPGAPLRHIDDAPRNDLAHSTGIGGPGTLTSRLEEPVPGLIEGRREYGNGFGIEGRIGPNQVNNAGHPRVKEAGSRRGISFFGCDGSIHWQRGFP